MHVYPKYYSTIYRKLPDWVPHYVMKPLYLTENMTNIYE